MKGEKVKVRDEKKEAVIAVYFREDKMGKKRAFAIFASNPFRSFPIPLAEGEELERRGVEVFDPKYGAKEATS